MKKVFLQHDNARPHTSIKTREAITSFGWITVPHSPYSPDLAPSDYPLFDAMKEELRGKHYADQRWSPRGRPWPRGRPRGHILESLALASKVKSLALASKPQVLENYPVLGSRTALFFE